MPLYRTYKTKVSFQHMLEDKPEVVDKSCLVEHQHIDSQLTIGIEAHCGKWIDFKRIKEVVEGVLDNGEFRGNIGIVDTETYITKLINRLSLRMMIPITEIFVELNETQKYGLEWRP